jgi:hypothetical protein
VEKAVDRCELSIVEGALSAEDEDAGDSGENDTLESKLIVRLYCKHGTVRSAYFHAACRSYHLKVWSKHIAYHY